MPSGHLIYAGETDVSCAQVSLTIILNLKDWKKTKGIIDGE